MAKASMEHAINGQMGHPAACMMENKTETPCSEKQVDYGARFSLSWRHTVCGTRCLYVSSTSLLPPEAYGRSKRPMR
jgi:hypothetical protein